MTDIVSNGFYCCHDNDFGRYLFRDKFSLFNKSLSLTLKSWLRLLHK